MSDPDPRYEINNPAIKATLQAISAKVKAGLPADNSWGFLLCLFEWGTEGQPGSSFYMSNGERADTVKMLKEWIARQERSDETHTD